MLVPNCRVRRMTSSGGMNSCHAVRNTTDCCGDHSVRRLPTASASVDVTRDRTTTLVWSRHYHYLAVITYQSLCLVNGGLS